MLEERLAERSAEVGKYLLDGLLALKQHKQVGDIRGKGLLIGIELVLDKHTKQPVGSADLQFVTDFCKQNGVIVGRSGAPRLSNTISLSPPLVITRSECDRIIDVLDRAIAELNVKLAA
jgi:4-aminobutyrate aminotransferase-like enzyme